MTQYSVQPREIIFVKGYGFLPFDKDMGKNIGKNISKNLSGKYSKKLLDHAKQSAIDALETISHVIQETGESTGDLIGNKLLIKLQKFQETYSKIFKRQLQMSMIKQYLKKGIHLQEKGSKLLIN